MAARLGGRGRETSKTVRIRNDLLASCHEIAERDLARQGIKLSSPVSDSQALQHALFSLLRQLEQRLHTPEQQAEFWRQWDELAQKENIAAEVRPTVPGPEYDVELERRFEVKIRAPHHGGKTVPIPDGDAYVIYSSPNVVFPTYGGHPQWPIKQPMKHSERDTDGEN